LSLSAVLPIIDDRSQRRLVCFKLGADLLDLRGLFFELRGEDFHCFLLLRDTCFHAGYASKFDTFLGNRTDRSTRDKIAHYLSVPAGCLNVTADGIFFVGGGENLDASRTLAGVTNEYDQLPRQLIGEVLPAIASGFPKPNA
jgi:hypothetical protein